jgi:hypothetical protein
LEKLPESRQFFKNPFKNPFKNGVFLKVKQYYLNIQSKTTKADKI